jgi:hypothetical protein
VSNSDRCRERNGKRQLMRSKIFDLAGKRIYVAGHRGMVGSAIVRRLAGVPARSSPPPRRGRPRTAGAGRTILTATKPDVVIVAAARVEAFTQQRLPGRVHIEISRCPQYGSRQPSSRREEAAVSGLLLHLSEAGAAAHARGELLTRSLSRPTNGTRSPRSPGSSCARGIVANTAPTSYR